MRWIWNLLLPIATFSLVFLMPKEERVRPAKTLVFSSFGTANVKPFVPPPVRKPKALPEPPLSKPQKKMLSPMDFDLNIHPEPPPPPV